MLLQVLDHLFLTDYLYPLKKPGPLLLPAENISIFPDLQADRLIFGWLFHLAEKQENLENVIRSFSII